MLVIIGLLAGGVLVGRDLIRAAELRSIVTEYNTYVSAVHTFKEQYRALPGDMPNATAFWGAAHADPATCPTAPGTGTQTCNGDGKGDFTCGAVAARRYEILTAWQHLANAGLIAGDYSGISGAMGCNHMFPGDNVPTSKFGGITGWGFGRLGVYAGGSTLYAMDYGGNFLFFGANDDSGSNGVSNPALTGEEAWGIDRKIDDGRPAHGTVIARHWGTMPSDNKCTINAADATDLESDYSVSSNAIACSLIFIRAF